jgi:ribokinase
MRAAVVGHVEWIRFARVERMPASGEIVHASDYWEEPGGGGAVSAVQLRKLAGNATFFTAFGHDDVGAAAREHLERMGVRVEAVTRPEDQRHAFVHTEASAERTITVIGDRLGPKAGDPLAWDDLHETDAVYFTAGDPDAVRKARAARVLVATARDLETLQPAGVEIDALVSSGKDAGERYSRGDLDPEPKLVIRTAGSEGGEWEARDGRRGRWDPTPLPGPPVDAYGAGDSFAAGLTYGLGAGLDVDRALSLAARCGAACLTGRGPYEGQLTG